jgi:hypothetical protein
MIVFRGMKMKTNYMQNLRKYTALLVAIVAYFLIHEGAHWLYAVSIGAFKQVNVIGLGIQIESYIERMSDIQFGVFNLLGPVATVICSYILVMLTPRFVSFKSDFARAIAFYMTIVFLVTDPLYLCFLSLFVGGGDMNGIVLLFPEMVVRAFAGILGAINILIIRKTLLPKYQQVYRGKRKKASIQNGMRDGNRID